MPSKRCEKSKKRILLETKIVALKVDRPKNVCMFLWISKRANSLFKNLIQKKIVMLLWRLKQAKSCALSVLNKIKLLYYKIV